MTILNIMVDFFSAACVRVAILHVRDELLSFGAVLSTSDLNRLRRTTTLVNGSASSPSPMDWFAKICNEQAVSGEPHTKSIDYC